MEILVTDPNERQWGMFLHLAALATLIGIPLGNVIGPLIIYLIKKDEYELVNEQGKEVLNFQITWTLILIVSTILVLLSTNISRPKFLRAESNNFNFSPEISPSNSISPNSTVIF